MKKNMALWAGIPILAGVEIAVIAFLHGTKLELPLLLAAAGVWLAWLCFTRVLPAVHASRVRKAAEKQWRTAATSNTVQVQGCSSGATVIS